MIQSYIEFFTRDNFHFFINLSIEMDYEFKWWHIPVYLILAIIGAWIRDYVYKNKYK